jgi:hypothetical protein
MNLWTHLVFHRYSHRSLSAPVTYVTMCDILCNKFIMTGKLNVSVEYLSEKKNCIHFRGEVGTSDPPIIMSSVDIVWDNHCVCEARRSLSFTF